MNRRRMNGLIAAGLVALGVAALAWIDGGREELRLVEQLAVLPQPRPEGIR